MNKALSILIAALLVTGICSVTQGQAAASKESDAPPRPATNARMIYVSPSGNDNATGLAPDQAVQTLEHGFSLLREGQGDWLLLERGYDYVMSEHIARPNGAPNTPIVISAWGEGTPPDLDLGPNKEHFSPSRLLSDNVTIQNITIAEIPANWTMEALAWHVQPLSHARGDRLPLFAWNLPLPQRDGLANARMDGRLEEYIEQLAARGIVPTVTLGFHWNWPGALSLARSLEDAGEPVFLLIPQADLIERWAWRNNNIWVTGPDASRGDEERQWPCLPLAETEEGAAFVDGLLRPFSSRDIDIAGVWFDDEALPHPWNGVYAAQKSTAECRDQYPPNILDSLAAFKAWAYELRTTLSSAIMAQPIHERFPDALVGNYGDYIYEEGAAETWGFNPSIPRQLGDMQAQMPPAYAMPYIESRYLKDRPHSRPIDTDRLHFWRHLTIISRCAANKKPGTLLIPYVNRIFYGGPRYNPEEQYIGMSRPAFREVMRHALLRGADTFYIFNLGHHPSYNITPEQSFGMLDDARTVYDEMLGFRDFWEQGEPMTFRVGPAPPRPEDWTTHRPEVTVWSGLRLGERCLVRAYTLEDTSSELAIEPWPGVEITITATRTPGYLIISRNGTIEQLPSQDAPPSP